MMTMNATHAHIADRLFQAVQRQQDAHANADPRAIVQPVQRVQPMAPAPQAVVVQKSRGRKNAEVTAASGKMFMCDLYGCEQVFKTKFSLKRHFKKHYVKKLKCKFCDKLFGLQQYREEHEHTHTGIKPYACNFCPMTFRQRGKLSLHKNAMHSEQIKNLGRETLAEEEKKHAHAPKQEPTPLQIKSPSSVRFVERL